MIPGQVVTYIFRCLCVYGLGNRRIIPEIPYLCPVFLPRIAIHGILTAAPGSPGAVFYCRLCGFRALILAANSGRFLHI